MTTNKPEEEEEEAHPLYFGIDLVMNNHKTTRDIIKSCTTSESAVTYSWKAAFDDPIGCCPFPFHSEIVTIPPIFRLMFFNTCLLTVLPSRIIMACYMSMIFNLLRIFEKFSNPGPTSEERDTTSRQRRTAYVKAFWEHHKDFQTAEFTEAHDTMQKDTVFCLDPWGFINTCEARAFWLFFLFCLLNKGLSSLEFDNKGQPLKRFKRTADVGMMYKHVFLPFFNYYRTLKWVTFEHSLSQCDMLSVLKQENTEHNIKCMESVLDKLKTKLNMGFDDEGCAFYITILRNLIDQERDLNGISFQDPEMVSYEGSIKEGTMSTPVELEDTGTDRDANNASVTVPETNRSDSDSDLVVVVPESTCTIHEVTHIASVETRRERSHSDGLINNIEPEVPSSDFKLLARRLLENHIKRKYSNSEGYLKPEKN